MPEPFPWHRLPTLSRESLGLHTRVARRLPPLRPRQLRDGLRELLGDAEVFDVGVQVCPPGALAGSLADPLVAAAVLGPKGAPPLALELAPELALALVDRIVGGEGEPRAATGSLTDVERGVVLYAAARLLAPTVWRAASVVTSPLALAALIRDEGSAAWSAEVSFGSVRGIARIWVPDRAALAEAPPRSMPRLPIMLSLSAGEGLLHAGDLETLRPGDVVVLDACWWKTERRIRVRVSGARRTTWWCDADLRIVEVETGHDAPTGEGSRMSDEDTTDVVAQVGDAPVSLSVELARLTLPLEELARLRPGEVLATGRPIGERVVVRAGDQVIGEGELVDVDGEIGVRMLSIG